MKAEVLLAVSIIIIGAAAPLHAQGTPAPGDDKASRTPAEPQEEDPRELLLAGDRSVAVPAAIALFKDGQYDDWFREHVLRAANSRPEARRSLLEAIALSWRLRPQAALKLARLSLADQDAGVREAAARALAAVERPEAYADLLDALRDASKLTSAARVTAIETVVDTVERKRDPIAATGVLVEALGFLEGPDETRVQRALKRLTGRSFASQGDWRKWYDTHRHVPQRDWLLETIKQLEADRDGASKEARRLFERLLETHGRNQDARFAEISDVLAKEAIPAVRLAAIKELGSFKRNDKAIDLLIRIIESAPKDADDEALREALVALGQTEDPKSLPLIARHLESGARSVRLAAIRGIGFLRSEEGVPLLLARVERDVTLADPEITAKVAIALGRIGKDPTGRAALALVALVDRVRSLAPSVSGDGLSTVLQGACNGLAGLAPTLPPGGALAKTVTASLGVLVEHKSDADVRREAVLALGTVPHDDTVATIATRLNRPGEALRVQQAAIKATGDQALRSTLGEPALVQAIDLLALGLTGTEEVLKAEARNQLKRLTSPERAAQLEILEALGLALKKRGLPDGAVAFLQDLPVPRGTEIPAPRALRIWSLILERALARLRLDAAKEALIDFEDLVQSPLAQQPDALRSIRLGRAQALVATGEPRKGAELAAEIADKNRKDQLAWKILEVACEELLKKGERATVKELFASLEKAIDEAPPEARAAVTEISKKAQEAPAPKAGPPESGAPVPGGAGSTGGS